ncbi:MAG: YmdB family metallophosphoesterase, partial [Nitrospinae bacterium]|nr:YmdB family metallophosphoesterase [Nitrospinota bacterium]
MKILAIGDVVGRVGRRSLSVGLNAIVTNTKADFVLANAENLAGGFGFTRDTVEEMFKLGVDALTTGNHVWDKKEALDLLPREPRLLRPANFPEAAPGKGAGVFTSRGDVKVGVLNLQGRVF